MRRTLYLKFLLAYLAMALFGFIVSALIGSRVVEQNLIRRESESIYQEAVSIASSNRVRYQTSQATLQTIYDSLSALSAYEDAQIWILNSQAQILIDTSESGPLEMPEEVQGFDPTTWGNNYYQIGNFYGYFSDDMMSVISPITANMEVKGYVVIHLPIADIYEERETILSMLYLLFVIFLLISLLLLVFFTISIYRPLQKIRKGAEEFALGHLNYEISVKSRDEIGYLATTLNNMSDELAHTAETQRNFVANVSHDFRSPLTSIKGYLIAIEDGTIPPEMQDHYIRIIINETERLENLTNSLLTLDRLDIGERIMNFRVFDINRTIKNTAATFEGICTDKKITIDLILTAERLYVYADMEQIQQVLYNLLDNAIKFSPADSTITVETNARNDRVFISVKDRGCGISKENLSKIWDRFYKTDTSRGKDRKGTGLGLAIVREIINAHHQTIDVISTEDVGTEFIFTLETAE